LFPCIQSQRILNATVEGGSAVLTTTGDTATLAITFAGASGDIGAAASSRSSSSSVWSRVAVAGAAMAAAHYMGGSGLLGAAAAAFVPQPVDAACINTITIYVPVRILCESFLIELN
jgi:hypothetical protein